MNSFAIKVENISKRYRIGLKEQMHDSLGGAITSWFKAPLTNFRNLRKLSSFEDNETEDVVWALRDISFDVAHSEVVGIVGRNGAGKTTLLKIISRITDPTSGRIIMNGRVSSLLEVGTGFHQELTGRENVYLNGVVLGMSKKEIDRRFDEIVAFSEVEKFIDTPVKRYSSGMKVRLAFAVAAHLEPEIMLVDEVLAVGDVAFQKKCLEKMGDVAKIGRTILFVSHDMNAIQRLCTRCILLKDSRVAMAGETNEVIARYLQDASGGSSVYQNENHSNDPVVLRSAQIMDMSGQAINQLRLRQPFNVEMMWDRKEAIKGAYYMILIHDSLNRLVTIDNTKDLPLDNESAGEHFLNVRIDPNRFAPGIYYVSFACYKWRKGYIHSAQHALEFEIVYVSETGAERGLKSRGAPAMILDSQWSVQRRGNNQQD